MEISLDFPVLAVDEMTTSTIKFSGKAIWKSSISDMSAMSFNNNNFPFPLDLEIFVSANHGLIIGSIQSPLFVLLEVVSTCFWVCIFVFIVNFNDS